MTTEAPHRPIRKFNPGTLQSDEEVVDQFVVRTHELGIVLDVLRGNIESPSCQHVLIVAPRGQGKTMLLARVAAELRLNEELSGQLLPVQFMEESQEILNLADLWLETLFHLARACATCDPELAGELRDRHAALSQRWREQALEEHARAAVLHASDRLNRRLVLMVENLQTLCKDVDEHFGWKLRGVLQTEPQVMLVSSATSRFSGLDDAKQPFFEMFRILDLKPLTTDECRRLWQVVSGDEVSGREMRPLEILSGGSPRLLVIVATFARHQSLRRLMEELVALIDEHTEYFRGHLEVLAKTERRVYVAILDLWQLSTPAEISARARMDVRTVSTMLGRLVNRGAIIVEGSGRKRHYTAAERLYSIYYKLRRERDEAAVVENLIRFMTVFYSEAERTKMFPALITEALESSSLRRGFDRAAMSIPELHKLMVDMRQPSVSDGLPIEDELGLYSSRETGTLATTHTSDQVLIGRLFTEISEAIEANDLEKAIGTVNRTFTTLGSDSSKLPERFAVWALGTKAKAYRKLGDSRSAILTYEEIANHFGASKDQDVRWRVATALIEKGRALEILGKLTSALSVYEEVEKRWYTDENVDLHPWVIMATHQRGRVLQSLGDLSSALLVYEHTVERFATSKSPVVWCCVATLLNSMGRVLQQLDNLPSALSAYERTVDRLDAVEPPVFQDLIAEALSHKGDVLWEMGNRQSAVSVYGEVMDRFGASEAPCIARNVVRALASKSVLLNQLDDSARTVSTCNEIMSRFGSSKDSETQSWVALALLSKGQALQILDDSPAALTAYNESIDRLRAVEGLNVREWTAAALYHKGFTLEQLGDSDSAMSVYDETMDHFASSEDSATQYWVVESWIAKADIEVLRGRAIDALRTFDEFKRNLDILDGETRDELTLKALRVRTQALLVQQSLPDAKRALSSMYQAFVPRSEAMMHEMLRIVPDMIAAGLAAHELIEILSRDDVKAAALTPLIVALRQHSGQVIRAPNEVLGVAADIRKHIAAKSRAPNSRVRAEKS